LLSSQLTIRNFDRSAFLGIIGNIGHKKDNAAARKRTEQRSRVFFCDHYSTGYSVKGDRIQAAMQIAAWPGFWGKIDDGMERTHEGNTEEIKRALSDSDYQEQLCQKYFSEHE
jgi:hypothetical protein